MLLGQARGKVGDVVFYVRNGIQQTRPRNRQPQNPQTYAQMAQRVKMAAPVLFYRRQRDFFKYAYKKSARESFYNAFIRYNINIAPYLTREQVANGVKVPAPYIIADGNLTPVNVTGVVVAGPNLQLNTNISSVINSTWGDFRKHYSLNYGDMMTIVGFATQGLTSPRMERIIEQHVFDVESENMPIGYDMGRATWTAGGAFWAVSFNAADFGLPEWSDVGAAIVLSSNRGGVECSFAQLALSDTAQFTYDELRSDAQLETAIASYSDQSDAILDPQNADENMAEFIQLYTNATLQIVKNAVSGNTTIDDSAYYDTTMAPTVSSISKTLLSGADVLHAVNADGAGVLEFVFKEMAAGSVGVYKLNLLNEQKIVATAIITASISN